MKIDNKAMIDAYNHGQSMNSIAKTFGTYPTTVKRVLEKNNVKLRHDGIKKGAVIVRDGEKLIEWAKAQDRLVTKAELAMVLGKKKLSPSYFIKYPELGQYIASKEQKDIQEYALTLYKWLKDNDIPYKPNDRTRLKLSVSALLLGKYENLAIQIQEKPKYISIRKHEERTKLIMRRAKEAGVVVIFLNKEHFEDLDSIKSLLDSLKKVG